MGWMINADGTPSEEFSTWIGAVVGGGGGITGNPLLTAPTGLTATVDRPDDVTLNWLSVATATSYTVYRSVSSNSALWTSADILAGPLSVLTHVDIGAVPGTHYFYAVRASTSALNSGFSNVAGGVRTSTLGGTVIREDIIASNIEVTVPAGATAMELLMWGSGGRGGNNSYDGWVAFPYTKAYGGGGNSGAFIRITGATVVPGEKFVVSMGIGVTTSVHKTSNGNPLNATVSAGAAGNSANYIHAGLAGAAPSSNWGANNLGSGEIQNADCREGNAGTAGTLEAGGVGGAGIAYAGRPPAGGGGNGVNTKNAGIPGNPGKVIFLFT